MIDSTPAFGRPGRILDHIRAYQELVGTDIHFAFQTILDSVAGEVVGFEALVRGVHGEGAATVINRVEHEERIAFDQACRIRALEAAARNGIDADLHLNCSDIKPDNVELVADVTRHIARRYDFDCNRIVLELSNLDKLSSRGQLAEVGAALRQAGLRTLADNFGRRNADLMPIARFRPEQLKLDRLLVQNVHENPEHQAIIRACRHLCHDLGIIVVATGVESMEEFLWLQKAGIQRFQGYFFAQPGLDEDLV